MVNEEKIKIMTQMAINDKYHTHKDKHITSYYPEDYVYISNFKSRALVLILSMGIMVGHLLLRINSGMNMPSTLEEIVMGYVLPYGGVLIGILMFYTLVSTRQAKKRYQQAVKRMKQYHQLSEQLELYEKEKGEKYGSKRRRTHNQGENSTAI
ncbi:MAG: hypothetical protein ACRCTE_14485 [Cellulosilyticaceae bacterium]